MKPEKINEILPKIKLGPSRWLLDNVLYHDRTSNPETLFNFLNRIKQLESAASKTSSEEQELVHLVDLLDEMEEADVFDICYQTEDDSKENFIEELARVSAIQVLTNGKMDFETMNTACKLSPNDFILCAKRTQEIINSIRGLVIKGETLSQNIPQA
jgi:uncharacterized protein YjgD (DUF1641 family)